MLSSCKETNFLPLFLIIFFVFCETDLCSEIARMRYAHACHVCTGGCFLEFRFSTECGCFLNFGAKIVIILQLAKWRYLLFSPQVDTCVTPNPKFLLRARGKFIGMHRLASVVRDKWSPYGKWGKGVPQVSSGYCFLNVIREKAARLLRGFGNFSGRSPGIRQPLARRAHVHGHPRCATSRNVSRHIAGLRCCSALF